MIKAYIWFYRHIIFKMLDLKGDKGREGDGGEEMIEREKP